MDSQQQIDHVLNEAKAKVIWGDSIDEVRTWLDGQGISSMQADEILAACVKERAVEFRKRGIAEVIIGALVFVLPLLVVAAMYFMGIIFVWIAALCYLTALYGLFRCAKGLWWLLRGAKSEGSLAEV